MEPSLAFFVIVLIVWVFSVCVHEFAHAAVAYWGGDHGVAQRGYLTLNPLRYTDPLFSLLLPVVFLVLGGIGLPGGAVYIDDRALRSPRWRSAVSLAGPAGSALLLLALAAPFALKMIPFSDKSLAACLLAFLAGLQATAVLFNLLPVPPLDGFGIIAPFLPAELHYRVLRLGHWPFFILIVVLMQSAEAAGRFWDVIFRILDALHVPPHLFVAGFRHFRFWE